jgi:outer membrane murein-binding lipoprotein Lpp
MIKKVAKITTALLITAVITGCASTDDTLAQKKEVNNLTEQVNTLSTQVTSLSNELLNLKAQQVKNNTAVQESSLHLDMTNKRIDNLVSSYKK